MKTLAIAILNYNGRTHLENFMPSVVEHADGHDIYIIDNASTDDSKQFIAESFPSVQWMALPSNYGFAQGYNEGLKTLEGQYENYLLLNSDVEVTHGYTQSLLTRINMNEVMAVQPKILSYTKKTHFEHAGASGGFIDKNGFPFCRGRIFTECEEDSGQYDSAIPIFWASGACLMVKSAIYHQLDGFDESFYAHMEEIDLCWRIQKLGGVIYVEPAATVFHLGGGTLPYDSPQKVFLNFRNNLFMITKNTSGFWPLVLFRRMTWDGLAAFQFLFKGNLHAFWQVFLAHMQWYRHLSRLLKKRQPKKITLKGFYNGNIVLDFYLKKKKRFDQILP